MSKKPGKTGAEYMATPDGEAQAQSEVSAVPKGLVQFFRESPLVGLELDFDRDHEPARDAEN